ncbi:ABC transporter permease [Halogeometricum sp. S1BR25-6]|uniref:ABC transporter permease n=1 Tax=Halogeometricum salsisoli TaxID=2950536 RepID=A0ABU2GD58_9EURY|nr:ABC transporter permease [Halogeometricum sp. S1BR25-6]MDS0298722.1 ABC transporter permease [Halogeometricum sp. S1BR25-6]
MNLRDSAERLVRASAFERFLISAAALFLSIAVGFVLILAAGRMTTCGTAATSFFGVGFCYDPITVYDRLFLGAFGNVFTDPLNGQFATTLSETTVLMFTGVAVAVAFRAGIFNIGTQGQLVVGALATAVAVLAASPLVSGLLGTLLLVPFGLLVGAVFGGAYGAIPGLLKAYADANEVITTIMLNFVATSVALFLVQDHFADPESAATQTVPLPDYAVFPSTVFRPRDDFSLLAFLFAVAVLVGIYVFLERTSFGYDLRTSGIQPEAAEYGGVDAPRTVVASMALSGALGGLGGAVYVLMILGNFQTGVPSYGFDGITVSILAGNNPLGVGFAALLFGVLKSGSIVVDVGTDVPPQLVGVLRGLIILFVAMPEFFRMIGRRVWTFEDDSGPQPVTDGGSGGERDE